jgi:hypothetical protein
MIQLERRSCIMFSLSMVYPEIVRLIKICLNETYSRVRLGKHLCDMFPITNGLIQGDDLSLFLFNFALEYAIRRVQVKQDDWKLNGTHRLLFYLMMLTYWAEARMLLRKTQKL